MLSSQGKDSYFKNFMKYFIHILLWISSLSLHTENHKKKKKDSGNLSQENNHEVGKYMYMYKSYLCSIIYNSKTLEYMNIQQ